MLYWTAFFLAAAVIAALLGFGGLLSAGADVAKVLCVVFGAIFVASLFKEAMDER